MDSIQLQKYIIDNNLVPVILDSLNCKGVRDLGKEFRSTHPGGTNVTSMIVDKENLHVYCYSDLWSGNIYTLCMKTLNLDFKGAIAYICSLLKINYDYKYEKKISKADEILSVFTRYKNRDLNVNDNEYLDDVPMLNYQPYLHMDWIQEGITEKAREDFDIQYDGEKRRIIIPHRNWETGKIMGIMSRTTIPNYDILGISKYYPIIPYPKGTNLYGLYENYKSIIAAGYVVVYEAEKSVLKRYSRHDYTGVAVCTHSVSDIQAEILISLNVDIVIAWDKDVPDKDIFKACNKFKKIRNVYYIKDEDGVLGEKDSPADMPNDEYLTLFEKRVKYK